MQNSGDSCAVFRKWAILLIFLTVLGCKIVFVTPLPTEIPSVSEVPPVAVVQAIQETSTTEPEATAEPQQTPTLEQTSVPTSTPVFLQNFSMKLNTKNEERLARKKERHGLIIAFVLPLVAFGIPWLILEFFIIRYVQPRGIDLSTVRIKAQDGLFIEAAVSVTAHRSLTLASTRMTWSTVQDFVEKTIEQELIHEALNFPSLDDLERNLKMITEKFLDLPIIQELSRDFGLEVLRFNVETRYPQETMDALNRKAEASAGGAAYLAYAAAAHLDPDTPESRDLYKIYQETSGQVDAARNLGGGIASLAQILGRDRNEEDSGSDD